MKYTHLIAVATIGLALPSQAALVSYVFSSQASPVTTSTVGDSAGVLGTAGDTWQGLGSGAISGLAVSATALVDVDGGATPYTFAANGVGAHGSPVSNNQTGATIPFVNSWFRRDSFADPSTFTFAGLTAGDTVDLVVFINHHNGNLNLARGGSVTVDGTTASTVGATGAQTSFTEGTNFVQFDGLVVDGSGQLIVDIASQVTTNNEFVDLNGFQLNVTPVPEPSAALLAGLGVLGLIRRRRA